MEIVIALLVALAVGGVVYQLRPVPSGYWADRLGEGLGRAETPLPAWRGALTAFAPLIAITPAGWLKALGRQLYWSQIRGHWAGWALAEVAALHLAIGVAGGVLALLVAPRDMLLLGAGMAVPPLLLNLVSLRARARRVQRQLAAELPEFVTLLSADVAAGTSLQEAVIRLSGATGVCAAWFHRAVSRAQGGTLFTPTASSDPGALLAEALESGEVELVGLALNLDKIHQRGTGAQALLRRTAARAAEAYVGEAQLRAEKVGGELIFPMILMFFLPFLVVILSVLAAPLLAGGLF